MLLYGGAVVIGAAVWLYFSLQPNRAADILNNAEKMCGQPVRVRGDVVKSDGADRDFYRYSVADGSGSSIRVQPGAEKTLPSIGQHVSITGVWNCSNYTVQEMSRSLR